jgi:hypothetical protein
MVDGLRMEDIEEHVVKLEAWAKRGDGLIVKYVGGEVRLNNERISQ